MNYMYILFTVLITAHKYQCKLLETSDPICDLKQITEVIKVNSDVIFKQVKFAGSTIQQYCADAKHKIKSYSEAESITAILGVMQNTLSELENTDDCSKDAQVHFNTLHDRVHLQYIECGNHSKINEMFLEHKMESIARWMKSVRKMTVLALQKCAMKYIFGSCSVLKTCCLDVIGRTTQDIVGMTQNSIQNIESILLKQNDCFNFVTGEALNITKSIQEEIFKCNVCEAGSLESPELFEMGPDGTVAKELPENSTQAAITVENAKEQADKIDAPESKAKLQAEAEANLHTTLYEREDKIERNKEAEGELSS